MTESDLLEKPTDLGGKKRCLYTKVRGPDPGVANADWFTMT